MATEIDSAYFETKTERNKKGEREKKKRKTPPLDIIIRKINTIICY